MTFDAYTFQARLRPALLVVMPAGLVVASLFPATLLKEGLIVATLTIFGFTALLSELGRDAGKRKQDKLWKSWGGAPSVRMLRHRDKNISELTRSRYHAKLAKLLGRAMPTPEEEKASTSAADAIYKTCGDYLLEKTRDAKKFPLILKENISYGFRRNLWAMKPAGIFLSSLGLVVCGSLAAYRWTQSKDVSSVPILGAVLCAVLLVLWVLRFNPDWIRVTADAYAKRLLAACDDLEYPAPKVTIEGLIEGAISKETPEPAQAEKEE